jgi:hypothetical protein
MFSLGDGVLNECRSLFFGRWLVIPAKANQHYGNQEETDNVVLVHF